MDNGRNRGKFSEGGRMGFEPVENVGLAAKESAQEILKIFNQVHEPRVVHSSSLPRKPAPSQWVAQAYLIGQQSVHGWVCGYGRSAARPSQICQPAHPRFSQGPHSASTVTVLHYLVVSTV